VSLRHEDDAANPQDEATDVRALRDLADRWRDVSRRSRHTKDRLLRDDDPGPHMTAIQLEWAAREVERLRAHRDKLLDRLEADPGRAAIATLDGLRKIWTEDDEQTHRILDWIGVAGGLALPERVRILALDLATRQGHTLEEAERLAPPAFKKEAI
jgi:hypothetical protein